MRKKLLRSRSGFEKPESREEAIMQNILGASNVLKPAESNIEEILQAILYNTPYTKEAEFEIEKILLAIKNNGTYDGEGESRDTKILIAILNDLDYTEEAESRIEELFIEWLHQRSSIKVLEGIPPLTFTSRGLPLINYLIEGNTVQNGTPTPDNPIMPQGTGDLETAGAKAGQYKIPISSANTTTTVYLGEVQSVRKIRKLVLTGKENFFTDTSAIYNNTLYFGTRIGSTVFGSNRESLNSHFYTALRGDNPQELNYECSGFNPISSYSDYYYMRINLDTIGVSPSANANVATKAFKAWLASKYGNGTPVTIWYVLANEETAVVNEPLMKIGNYADTVSMEQAGVEIPTVSGSNTLDVNTTVKPSNVYIEYK